MAQQPLLSISIPTYNRVRCLDRLLIILHEQSANDPRVEIIVSDNASTDGTKELVEDFLRRGMKFRYVRNEINVGGDENIRRCYAMAQGRYTWVFGDDDVIAPGGLQTILSHIERGPDYSLVFVASYPFQKDYLAEMPKRLWISRYCSTSDAVRFANLVGTHSDFVFVSSMIVNKQQISAAGASEFEGYVQDNIVQFGWVMTAFRNFRRGLFIDDLLVGGAFDNRGGGYDAAKYFGANFTRALDTWLPANHAVRRVIVDNHLSMWCCSWVDLRSAAQRATISMRSPHQTLAPLFSRNIRYWLCTYPLVTLPVPLAKLWMFPLMLRRKLLRFWYQTITPSATIEDSEA